MNGLRAYSALTFTILLFITAGSLSAQSAQENKAIVDALKQKDWSRADSLLSTYIQKYPEKQWAYSSHSYALRGLEKYAEALSIARTGLQKWPSSEKLKKAVAYSAGNLGNISENPDDKIKYLELSIESFEFDYNLYRLAKAYRETGQYEKAINALTRGLNEYPDYPYFESQLLQTRYLYFKTFLESGDENRIREFLEQGPGQLKKNEPVERQFYTMQIINRSLRFFKDRDLFESTYSRLLRLFPDDPYVRDSYGYMMYVIFRDPENENFPELKEAAIGERRKAYKMFWAKHKLPDPVTVSWPLKGPQIVWSTFGGTAMTHNGYAHYCYDFVSAGEDGKHYTGDRNKLDHHHIFGAPVYAAGPGEVVSVTDGFDDNPVGSYSGDGNYVTIDHGDYQSFYVHFKKNSIQVKEGQSVKKGQVIGLGGNSGMSSEPHLHFCIYGNFKERISVPFRFPLSKITSPDGKKEISNRVIQEMEIIEMKP